MFDEFDMVLDFDGLGLADLFAEADAIGDKYLTDEELEERNGLLFEAQEMLSECAEQLAPPPHCEGAFFFAKKYVKNLLTYSV